jgi:hypothetical protein
MANLNFWGFLVLCSEWVSDRATRILGITGGTLSVLLASNVIPIAYAKYCMAAIAVLTYWRGQSNASTVSVAKNIVGVSKAADLPKPPDPPVVSPK